MPDERLLADLADRVRYGGSPYHKRNPGDFSLTPPMQPRPDKTLCDDTGIVTRAEAQNWLQLGVRRGLISKSTQDGYPSNIWAVMDTGIVLEARYGSGPTGHYHGYPLFEPDPFRSIVLKNWN